MTKVYGIHGQTTAIIKFPVNGGSAWLTAEFRRGRIGSGPHNRPATYPTASPVEQAIIESHESFGKLIKLIRVVDDEPKAQVGGAVVTPHPEITSKEEAVTFLKKNGAKAKDYVTDDAIQAFATKIGVSFPNLYE